MKELNNKKSKLTFLQMHGRRKPQRNTPRQSNIQRKSTLRKQNNKSETQSESLLN